jgi:hypothetical protein
MQKYQAWGKDTCQRLLLKRIAIGGVAIMVILAFGRPTSIDEKVATAKDSKYRWIYGTPRQGATYVWFKNDRVTKIKQQKRSTK